MPPGNWTDLDTFRVIEVPRDSNNKTKLIAGFKVKKFLRPGYMIPIQVHNQINTIQSAQSSVNIIANRDPGGHAKGTFYFDQGWNPKTSDIKNHIYEHYKFLLTKNTLQKFDLNTGNSTGN